MVNVACQHQLTVSASVNCLCLFGGIGIYASAVNGRLECRRNIQSAETPKGGRASLLPGGGHTELQGLYHEDHAYDG